MVHPESVTNERNLESTVSIRPEIAALPGYKPGKKLESREGLQTLKLSSNENPFPPIPELVEAACSANNFNEYPDLAAVELSEQLAKRFEVPIEDIVLGTGSVALLSHLMSAVVSAGEEVVYAWRAFEAYPIAVTVAGAHAIQVPLTSEYRHDLVAIANAVTDRTRVVLLCSPNNPTGSVIHRDEFDAFMRQVPDGILVVVDAAYQEFATDPDAIEPLEEYRRHANVAVLQTFSKAYGLAGLRLGYLIAHQPVASGTRTCATPFGVSTVAQRVGIAALQNEAQLLQRVEFLKGERERVLASLRALDGVTIPETHGNFFWLPLGQRSGEFAAKAQAQGIAVRLFEDEGVRVSIGDAPANDRVIALVASFSDSQKTH